MFKIKYNAEAAKNYLSIHQKECEDKIDKCIKSANENINSDSETDYKKVIELLNDVKQNIKTILIGKPDELWKLYITLQENHPTLFKDGLIPKGSYLYKNLECIFNYKKFSNDKTKAYKFTSSLKVNICPYCNREYIFTVSDTDNLIRPELDHYFTKSDYPIFALSFCNLIPCGHICNSNIKHTKELNINDHLHPYIEDDAEFSFTTDMVTDENGELKIRIGFKAEAEKVKNTLKFFRLEEIYQYHSDVAEKTHYLFNAYPPEKLKEWEELLNKAGISVTQDDMLHILYREFNIESPDEEILGKLKKDLYQEINRLYGQTDK